MALAAGAKLGSYEILAPIGVGGMGEVYGAGYDAEISATGVVGGSRGPEQVGHDCLAGKHRIGRTNERSIARLCHREITLIT